MLQGLMEHVVRDLLVDQLNHRRLKSVGLKEPIDGGFESAEAAFSLKSNMEVTIILLKILGGNVLHDNFIGHVA
jgi:hypothetical protein